MDTEENSGSRDENIGLRDVKYIKTQLSGQVSSFGIPKYQEIFNPSQPHHPFYTYHDKPFEKERFQYSPIPVHVGPYDIKYDPSKIVNVLRCPIKTNNSRTIHLPI